jgi:putative RNA 2'-phosphotransferase
MTISALPDTDQTVAISRFLAKHLRHQPGALGMTLEPGGWAPVAMLLAGCATHGFPLTRAELDAIVATNDKQRFSFDATGTRIRANTGHTVAVDMELTAATPPATLYHGTGRDSGERIRVEGLSKRRRDYVQLTAERVLASQIGARHGRPMVFTIDAAAMVRDGYTFFRTDRGTWLVESVPITYLGVLPLTPLR